MKNEPQTASELMLNYQFERHNALSRDSLPDCVLPSETVKKFLLDVIDQTNFPGKMTLFVVQVKELISSAEIKQ